MSLELVIKFIIVVVLLVVVFFFIKNLIWGTGQSLTACEQNGGECMRVCASGMVRVHAYKCAERGAEYICCKDTEAVTGIPGSGLKCAEVNGECVNESEECPTGKAESIADCEEDYEKCCKPDGSAKSECEEEGGACMSQCADDYERTDEYECNKQEDVCCVTS